MGEGLSLQERSDWNRRKGEGSTCQSASSRIAAAYADGCREPSSGPVGPPSPIGRRVRDRRRVRPKLSSMRRCDPRETFATARDGLGSRHV
ncbi:hypothetical protein BDIM_20070 [Brevundimonas diminuta ATCC 11568]|nr:hypothetical protein BDIM_20070 [Brevundimonas diminuta ATCC 11568]